MAVRNVCLAINGVVYLTCVYSTVFIHVPKFIEEGLELRWNPDYIPVAVRMALAPILSAYLMFSLLRTDRFESYSDSTARSSFNISALSTMLVLYAVGCVAVEWPTHALVFLGVGIDISYFTSILVSCVFSAVLLGAAILLFCPPLVHEIGIWRSLLRSDSSGASSPQDDTESPLKRGMRWILGKLPAWTLREVCVSFSLLMVFPGIAGLGVFIFAQFSQGIEVSTGFAYVSFLYVSLLALVGVALLIYSRKLNRNDTLIGESPDQRASRVVVSKMVVVYACIRLAFDGLKRTVTNGSGSGYEFESISERFSLPLFVPLTVDILVCVAFLVVAAREFRILRALLKERWGAEIPAVTA